ncbi:MAG: hypothetical protein HOD92_16270 [Deltaproteobacteria bacterium]|jgi:hypothetical protein|nr:hypothetical protein [Deltaproteobacteria bacterium]
MKWLEVIKFQFAGKHRSNFKLNQLIPMIKQAQTEYQLPILLFKNAVIKNDLSIHIIHDTDPSLAIKSPLSIPFRSMFSEFGLVSYSRWTNEIDK